MKRFKKCLTVISAVVFFVSFVVFPVWAQPLSMGRVELKGKAVVKAGEGLVFQSPQDTEVPLMKGAVIETKEDSQALLYWTGKGALVLPGESKSRVEEKGLTLESGSVTTRLDPGQKVIVNALDCTFTIIAPPGIKGIASVVINKDGTVTASADTAKINGVCRHEGAFVLMPGGSGIYGVASSFLGPALIAGGGIAGIIAVIASSNGGGGGHASPYTP